MASRIWVAVLLLAMSMGLLAIACKASQLKAVQRFNDRAKPVQLACLDVNSDGLVNADDASDPTKLFDITGDGKVTDSDVALVRQLDLLLPSGKPKDCGKDSSGPKPDWQVSPPPALDCQAGGKGVLLLAIGGGAVDLSALNDAAGARWMVEELSGQIKLPTQIASVAPGLDSTKNPQPDAERWAFLFLSQRLKEQPCLKVLLLGHSHGGTFATATASRLEEAGFANQILLTVLIDRVTYLYAGDTTSIPQSSPVFNVYLKASAGQQIVGAGIDQPNVENFDASGLKAPEHGEQGGALKPPTHTTVDNSEDVLKEVEKRVVVELAK